MLFYLLDIKKHNKRSHGKRKNGIFKRKHKTVLSLFDLNILLNSGRHQMLSKLASLSISSLRKLDDEANKFYDRKHDLYEVALLTRCYTQHALRPYIDSEINHIRHFIKIPFIKKGIEFIDLPSLFRVLRLKLVSRRGRHWVWGPKRRRAIKEWSIAINNDWVDNQACSLPHNIQAIANSFTRLISFLNCSEKLDLPKCFLNLYTKSP